MPVCASAFRESPTRTNLLKRQSDREIRFEDVAAEAGDVPLHEKRARRLMRLRRERGAEYYAELWFTLTHERLDAPSARRQWHAVVRHSRMLSQRLGRNVGVAVAALDYLHNVDNSLRDPVLVDARRLDRIAKVATHDELTGLFDRRAMVDALHRELARAQRQQSPLSVLILDVDHFKRFNDTHGHLEGDAALQQVASACLGSVREMDMVCRYGGEELCILLPSANEEQGMRTAARIREAVADGGLVTVSIGVAASGGGGCRAHALLKAADDAMYVAKESGRNCTRAAPLLP